MGRVSLCYRPIGALPIWGIINVPGDLDEDGELDNVLPVTLLTTLGLHLYLAVIVDYDIILVRAFDRITTALPFGDRVELATGYAHRTISVSMMVGAMAYAFGSLVDLPVLVYFCWHSCLAMVGLYISLFSFFLASMVMLERSAKHEPPPIDSSISLRDSPPTKNSPLRECVVKNKRDVMFSKMLSHPVCTAIVVVCELIPLVLYFLSEHVVDAWKLTASFEGSEY